MNAANDPRLDIANCALTKILPGDAYILITTKFNDPTARTAYTSNADRESAIRWMKAMIAKWEANPGSWMKHD